MHQYTEMGPFLKVFQAQHPDAKVPADLQAKLDKDNAEVRSGAGIAV